MDGHTLEAEDLSTGETVACDCPDFPDHFGFFLPPAGISTIKEIKYKRICKEDLNQVIASFIQAEPSLERGALDKDNTIPEELTIERLGKIVRERYPELSEADQEAVRQHAIAVINITQQAKMAFDWPDQVQPQVSTPDGDDGGTLAKANTDLIEGVRKFINVRDLDIDLIDRINPYDAACAVLAKTMNEKSLRQIQVSIAGKKTSIIEDEARELAKRALQFKNERGRVPDIDSADAWAKTPCSPSWASAATHPTGPTSPCSGTFAPTPRDRPRKRSPIVRRARTSRSSSRFSSARSAI